MANSEFPIYRWKDREAFSKLFSSRIQRLGQVRTFGISNPAEFVSQVGDHLAGLLEQGMEFTLGITSDDMPPGKCKVFVFQVRRDRKGFDRQASRNEIDLFPVSLSENCYAMRCANRNRCSDSRVVIK